MLESDDLFWKDANMTGRGQKVSEPQSVLRCFLHCPAHHQRGWILGFAAVEVEKLEERVTLALESNLKMEPKTIFLTEMLERQTFEHMNGYAERPAGWYWYHSIWEFWSHFYHIILA